MPLPSLRPRPFKGLRSARFRFSAPHVASFFSPRSVVAASPHAEASVEPGVNRASGYNGSVTPGTARLLASVTAHARAVLPSSPDITVTRGEADPDPSSPAHHGLGVVDVRVRDLTRPQRIVLLAAFEALGWAVFDLGPKQGFSRHIHAVAPVMGLSPAARRQYEHFFARKPTLDGFRFQPYGD